MTDEEMAEEYTKNLLKKLGIKEDMLLENQPEYLRQESMNFVALDVENVTDGFLAGLKAGRPQWHYVKDGDLPKDDKQYLVLFYYHYKGKKEMVYGVRDNLHSDFEIKRGYTEQIIAWCEIPTLDKDQ